MKRLASFILAFIFLGSNLGFAVGTHFCGGHAMDTAVVLGHDDLSCGMMPEVSVSPELEHTWIHAIPCCKNEFQSLQLDEDFQNTIIKIAIEPISSLAPLFVLVDLNNPVATNHSIPDYTSPIRTEEVSIRFQVFRI